MLIGKIGNLFIQRIIEEPLDIVVIYDFSGRLMKLSIVSSTPGLKEEP